MHNKMKTVSIGIQFKQIHFVQHLEVEFFQKCVIDAVSTFVSGSIQMY